MVHTGSRLFIRRRKKYSPTILSFQYRQMKRNIRLRTCQRCYHSVSSSGSGSLRPGIPCKSPAVDHRNCSVRLRFRCLPDSKRSKCNNIIGGVKGNARIPFPSPKSTECLSPNETPRQFPEKLSDLGLCINQRARCYWIV